MMINAPLSAKEVAQRGQAIYDDQIRRQVEERYHGRFLALDIETGEYEIAEDEMAALNTIKRKKPDAMLYLIRVGFPTAYRIGGSFRVKP